MKPKKLLLVEDTPYSQVDIKRALEEIGIEVVIVQNEMDAQAKIAQQTFCAIITDINLSSGGGTKQGGFRVVRDARSIVMPVIVVTSFATEENRQTATDMSVTIVLRQSETSYLDSLMEFAREAQKHNQQNFAKRSRLVILVHGIRTRAEWQGRIRHLLEADGVTIVETVGYEYFDVFRFLCPFWTRRKPIEVVLKKTRTAIRIHRDNYDELIIVAHSFGTFIIGTILRENPDIEPDRLLLCGCIQPATYAWEQLPNRPKAVLNEAGSKDFWPILAKSVTWGYGSTGTFGFQTPGVRDRHHNLAHSDYFKVGFAEEYWIPWIRDGVIKPSLYEIGERPATPFYKNLFEVIPLKWIILVLMGFSICIVAHQVWCIVRGQR